jgi:hypothetical protein
MTNLSKKNCGLCDYFKIKENRYLDRSFDHYCTYGEEKLLGDDSFSESQNVCKHFLKIINLDTWACYPWSIIKIGIKNVVLWNYQSEEAKVLSREAALLFIREVDK